MIHKILKVTLLAIIFPAFIFSCEEDTGPEGQDQAVRDNIVILDYFEENDITEYESTESGMYYIVETEGAGSTVPDEAIVKVHYTGSLLYGNVFDSSVYRDEPFEFQATTGRIVSEYDEDGEPVFSGTVIDGWIEAVSLMKLGEKTRFYIPSALAYKERGSGSIPGNSVIYFDIELLEILPL
ncbi:FKBP-type peptidyl-prolyl cis-trans isomerase [Flammeovirgaceae bacterium SG7u.111]|nr:FKBP-type peptidyl-prolyl cis-trans isomerase [Flammeovirgaceae bacterium SG7u.132]WPO34568.1 FKBP-type peptidyl-prolyl cis-trans isomerase [Flammeovirgaceae bacterium SG7u.111]